MTETIKMSTILPVKPQRVYEAWLDSKEHGLFTSGGAASIEPKVGGPYTAWDGYISGKTLELEPYRRVLQSWRSTDFKDGQADSLLEVVFEEVPQGTRLTLNHTNIPDGQAAEYKQGWEDFYFSPMKEYFSK
jgi:uncharacterized protein YndB with AHSA1/START domain